MRAPLGEGGVVVAGGQKPVATSVDSRMQLAGKGRPKEQQQPPPRRGRRHRPATSAVHKRHHFIAKTRQVGVCVALRTECWCCDCWWDHFVG